jgi:uroporphyrin-III C-methyltransferase
LEAVSTPRERQWTSTLQELAEGKADGWFDSTSPALIMIGAALKIDATEKDVFCTSDEIEASLKKTG